MSPVVSICRVVEAGEASRCQTQCQSKSGCSQDYFRRARYAYTLHFRLNIEEICILEVPTAMHLSSIAKVQKHQTHFAQRISQFPRTSFPQGIFRHACQPASISTPCKVQASSSLQRPTCLCPSSMHSQHPSECLQASTTTSKEKAINYSLVWVQAAERPSVQPQ